jgi:hypothetical protein
MRYPLIVLGLSGVVAVNAACSGSGSPTVATQAGSSKQTAAGLFAPAPSGRDSLAPAPAEHGLKCPSDRVYVADYQTSAIDIYPAHNPLRPKPCGYITRDVFGPSGISVGQDGTLYVSDYLFSAVTVYPRNHLSPSLKLFVASKPQYAYGGADGTLYVSESYANQIEEFAPGTKTPERTISITYPWGVATDSNNNLYVTSDQSDGGHIVEFAPGSTSGTDLGILIGFEFGITIAKDNSIVVSDNSNVDVFPPGATTPSRSFAAVEPFQIAFDQHEKQLFVATDHSATVGIYDFKTGALLGTMTGFREPDGVALDPPAPY